VTVDVVPQEDRPDRKVYTLTEAGQRELESWLSQPARLDLDLRNETFLKLMLAWRLARAAGRKKGADRAFDPTRVLDAERRQCVERLHELTGHRARAEREGAGVATLLLLDLAILRLNAFHQWLERCEETFRREAKGEG